VRKRILLGVFFLATSLVFAEKPERIGLGFLGSFAPLEGVYQTVAPPDGATNSAYTYETLGARMFFDFVYGEASAAYKAAITQLNTSVTASGTSTSQSVPFSVSVINVRLIGKYPFHLGFLTLFPLIGVAGDFCLSGSLNNASFTNDDKSDLSPWRILAGLGGDFTITQDLFVRIELTCAYDVTSEFATSYYDSVGPYSNSSGWEVEIAAGIGFTI
jgi:hypothetical protein